MMELHANSFAVLLKNLRWGEVGNEVDFIICSWVEDLFVGSHIIEPSSENHGDSISTNSDGGSCAIKSSISDTQNNDVSFQLVKLLFAF